PTCVDAEDEPDVPRARRRAAIKAKAELTRLWQNPRGETQATPATPEAPLPPLPLPLNHANAASSPSRPPKTGAPKSGVPKTSTHKAGVPKTSTPKAGVPKTATPKAAPAKTSPPKTRGQITRDTRPPQPTHVDEEDESDAPRPRRSARSATSSRVVDEQDEDEYDDDDDGDDDDEYDAPRAPISRKSRGTNRAPGRKLPRAESSGKGKRPAREPDSDGDDEFEPWHPSSGEDEAPESEESANRFSPWARHYHRDMFARRAADAKVIKFVEPPKEVTQVEPWDSIASHPRLVHHPERQFTPKVDKKNSGGLYQWALHAVQGATDRKFLGFPREQLTYEEALEVCRLLVYCLERWPNMDDISTLDRYPRGETALRTIFRAALCKLVTYAREFSNAIAISPDTLIPEPVGISWSKNGSVTGDIDAPLESLTQPFNPTSSENIIRLERLARYEISEIVRHSPVITTQADRARTSLYIEERFSRHSAFGVREKEYGNSELMNTKKYRRLGKMMIESPKALHDNVDIKPLSMEICSINLAWLQVVKDAGSEAWKATGDILEAWKTIAATTDDVNYRILHDEPAPNQSECLSTLDHDLSLGEGGTYKDEFSGQWTTCPPQLYHPEVFSIDAPFPFDLGSTGESRYHSPGNLAAVPVALNYMKNGSPPIALQKIRDYFVDACSLEPRIQQGDTEAIQQREAARRRLLEDFHNLTEVVRKIPRNKSVRLRVRIGKKAYRYVRRQLRKGRPHQVHSLTSKPKQSIFRYLCPPRPSWLIPIIEEIERWTGVSLPRGRDGCPYFLHQATMDNNWNWDEFYTLVHSRLGVMQHWCNKDFATIDTIWTLMLECILLACLEGMVVLDNDPDAKRKRAMKEKYAEFLHLPLTFETRNLLCFAFAKFRHHERMWTAWPTQPSCLQERLDADDDNNVIIESQASNNLKHDFFPCHYPLLKRLVKRIRMPKKFVDEDLELGPYDSELEKELEQAVARAKLETAEAGKAGKTGKARKVRDIGPEDDDDNDDRE
ncbi:uncharacterized protein DNG_04286, partial [Cephalotrichum gorgonifer]